jgi:hypothetical protein
MQPLLALGPADSSRKHWQEAARKVESRLCIATAVEGVNSICELACTKTFWCSWHVLGCHFAKFMFRVDFHLKMV